ncbi:DASH complex subunit SPC19 [Lachancea thermotolerans]
MTESLSQCCDVLESAVELLSGTVSKLENQSNLSNQLTMSLLQPRRVFELIPEYDIQRAKLDLIEEVEPLVKSLSGKLSKSLVKLERERDTLQQTLELNSLRLNNQFSGEEMSDPDVSSDLVIMTS